MLGITQNLLAYYPVLSIKVIQEFAKAYFPLVELTCQQFQINLHDTGINGDHFGLQVLSDIEFDQCHKILLQYTKLVHDHVIHQRRNRVYHYHLPVQVNGITIPKIEIFEPKPDADISKLRPGIEHIAFVVDDYDQFLTEYKSKRIPIDKEINLQGSKFFKTKFINIIEIEFRNDELGGKD